MIQCKVWSCVMSASAWYWMSAQQIVKISILCSDLHAKILQARICSQENLPTRNLPAEIPEEDRLESISEWFHWWRTRLAPNSLARHAFH